MPTPMMFYEEGPLLESAGLSVAQVRRLIESEVIIPERRMGGQGQRRLWTAEGVQSIGFISALVGAGLSLPLGAAIRAVSQHLPGEALPEPKLAGDPSTPLGTEDYLQSDWLPQPAPDDLFVYVRNDDYVFRSAYAGSTRERTVFLGRMDRAAGKLTPFSSAVARKIGDRLCQTPRRDLTVYLEDLSRYSTLEVNISLKVKSILHTMTLQSGSGE